MGLDVDADVLEVFGYVESRGIGSVHSKLPADGGP